MKKKLKISCIILIIILPVLFGGCLRGIPNADALRPNFTPVTTSEYQPQYTPAPTPTPTPTAVPTPTPTPAPNPAVVDATSLTGKLIAGYQGWFSLPDTGGPFPYYSHWIPQWNGTLASDASNLKLDLYPDVREYPANVMKEYTGVVPLGNGTKIKLFNSALNGTVDLHFNWMKQNGLDGVAIQRFGNEIITGDGWTKPHFDQVASQVKLACEKYGRVFYITYDLSQMTASLDNIKTDWTNTLVNTLQLTSSGRYLKHEGKPIVQLWGIGVNGSFQHTAAEALDLINWFKAQGCYVMGGVPTNWRTDNGDAIPGFKTAGVYDAMDAISPWYIGRFTTVGDTGYNNIWNATNGIVLNDVAYCLPRGIEFIPTVWPGFSWSFSDGVINKIPRQKGSLLWNQLCSALRISGINTLYIAMFDEYDESTAIAKAAEDSSMVPNNPNRFYLTLSADGQFISSDFYLRLAGKVNRAMNGLEPLTQDQINNPQVTIPYTLGPTYARTSFERYYDARSTSFTEAPYLNNVWTNVVRYQGSTSNAYPLYVENEQSHFRKTSVKFSAYATTSNAYAKVHMYDLRYANLAITNNTYLDYWIYAGNAGGTRVKLEVVASDGTMMPASYTVTSPQIGAWVKVTVNLGSYLNGKTAENLIFRYNGHTSAEDILAYVDDVTVEKR